MNQPVAYHRRQVIQSSIVAAFGVPALLATATGQHPEPSPEGMSGEDFLAGPCPQVLRVSKRLEGTMQLHPTQPCPCECAAGAEPQRIFQADYRAVLKFASAAPCDETELEPLLQGGTELWLEGTLLLRLAQCPESGDPALIGRNQGHYRIHRYRPNQDVMEGDFCGTEGVLPTAPEAERCCALGHGVGSLCGTGFNKLQGWSLSASYHSLMQNLSPGQLCEQAAIPITMDFTGVLIGPCAPVNQRP